MKVLIISAEVWQDGMNGGNVLSNVFSDTGFELAQIYCNPGAPENNLCCKYYQMTDAMVIRSFLRHKPIGREFNMEKAENTNDAKITEAETPNRRFYSFFHRYRLGVFYWFRAIAWNLSNWKNENLRRFVSDFSPDVIFAPCYGNKFMLRLTRYVAGLTGKNVISYISDDSYTLRQFSLSPFYWIGRFSVRRQLRKTFPYYSLVYTMTEAQKRQCEKDFGANMKILLKSAPFGAVPEKEAVNNPIRIVYAGGIYLNRYKTLAFVAEAVRKLNCGGIKAQLHIYTANEITPKINRLLNDGVNSILHESISQEKLREVYHNSDIALHAESFDLKNRLAVRMSFSTKIVDCLSSGCAVMAVCDEKQGGYVYLKENDAALCACSRDEVYRLLRLVSENNSVIKEYAKKAKVCCEKNHDKHRITQMITADFERYT